MMRLILASIFFVCSFGLYAQENTVTDKNYEAKEHQEVVEPNVEIKESKLDNSHLLIVESSTESRDSLQTSESTEKTNVVSSLKQGLYLIKCLCDKSVKVELINGQGNVVSFRNLFSKRFLNLSSLSSNVYLVRANEGDRKPQ